MARIIFGIMVGILVAVFSYQWITDSSRRVERGIEESVVFEVRALLAETLALKDLEIVDPVDSNREAGKSYVYRTATGWQVSGHYRRQEEDPWQQFLMNLDEDVTLLNLLVDDPEIVEQARVNPALEVIL
ncbi:MAG: hypothetical protein HOL98_03040 [Gammaproteobacteria bacterium]|nr:hypothetical protein [Gammaproteobacteria bacterium]MBT5202409.1 hypothetical protein [Gammaproteobacteria bacterium]MBT5601631.1 hypothetical protein [Gammaproteobacteria bacterium]MBT6246830.1 hypothetical protein [Gammaproteobacteria bacterium]